MPKNEAVTKVEAGALVSYEELSKYAGQGTENIGANDVRPPILKLAQSSTPQAKRGNPKYIDDLREGDLFNDLSGQNYAAGPLAVVFLSFLGNHAVEFDKEGKIVDGNVSYFGRGDDRNDPRTEFSEDGEKPKATVFHDFLAWLPETGEVVAVSFKVTQVKIKDLLSLIRYPLNIGGKIVTNPPAFARTFNISTAVKQQEPYSWAVYQVALKGATEAETFATCATLYEQFAKKNVIIERDAEEAAAGTQKDDVPF